MEDQILKYLSKYTRITPGIERAVTENVFFKTFEKGAVLLEEGAFSNECYFILKGCMRSYYLKDGEEITTEFYTEEQAVTPSNFGTSTPSEYYLECVEDTIASVANPELEKETFQEFPELESLARIIGEKMLASQQRSFSQFKTASPEQRYKDLLKTRPTLLQRVPQHQIASYLGIKPESLSRIRKRITAQK